VGDLGGVEETSTIRAFGGLDEHAVGDAGDEVADVFQAGERRHGGAEGLLSFFGCRVIAFVQFFCSPVSEHIGFAAAHDGEIGGDGSGFGRLVYSGFGHDRFSLGGWVAAVFFIVREKRVIICKTTCGGAVTSLFIQERPVKALQF
jgi:hypothetical protein